MSAADRRGANLGVALTVCGLYLLLGRQFHFRGPGPILLLIGTVLFAVSALSAFRGPLVPAGVLLGLGAGFLLRDPLEGWLPNWATLLLFLGSGLLLAEGVGRLAGRERRPGTLVPGLVLLAIAAAAGLSQNLRLPDALGDLAWRLWPWALVAAGAILLFQALRRRKSSGGQLR